MTPAGADADGTHPLRIAVLDARQLIAQGLGEHLNADPDLDLLVAVASWSEAEAVIGDCRVDVVVVSDLVALGDVDAAKLRVVRYRDDDSADDIRAKVVGIRRAVRRPRRARPCADPNDLSRREAEVLELVTAGLSARFIAGRLGLSPRTVDNYTRAAFAKLGVNSRAEAASLASKRGWSAATRVSSTEALRHDR